MSAAPRLAPATSNADFVETELAHKAPSVTAADLDALLEEVEGHIKERPALRLAVMDVQLYDATLIILANGLMSPAFIRLALEPLWKGPIEVYDAASMFGPAVND
ncbi:MAG: hypothetical protein AAFO68_01045 [Pseudomonadota bacterium]